MTDGRTRAPVHVCSTMVSDRSPRNEGSRVPAGTEQMRAVEAVVRSLTAAIKTLRLYPAASPIPMQAMQVATEAVSTALALEPTLALVVAREGFTHRGEPVNAPGATDLANVLTSHGIAELDFVPGCTAHEISALLGVVLTEPADVQAKGGPAAALALSGASNVLVSEVVLTTVTTETAAIEDVDAFLRELASDEQKLAAWLSAAVGGDPAALSDGLEELARAVGEGGLAALEAKLGKAFLGQAPAGRDVLVGLALKGGDASGVLQGMMQTLAPGEVATSLADGLYAKNMLSMSNVLTAIPFGALSDIIEELRPMLAAGGHTEHELTFLNRMLEARANTGHELPLADRQIDYQRVAAVAAVDEATLSSAKAELGSSRSTVNTRTVNPLLSLLDQHTDFGLWSKTLANLAGIVPSLIEQRDVALADRVFADLTSRESRTSQPWPGLPEQMRVAFERATSADAMAALLDAVLDDPAHADAAASILRRVDAPAQKRFVAAAIAERQRDGLRVADQLLGRRLVDLLVEVAPEAEWFQVGEVALRLSGEGDSRSRDALHALARRPDERSRQEVAKALASTTSPLGMGVLSELVRDQAPEVAVMAVRSLGHVQVPGAAMALSTVFEALDSTGKDFPLAREVLGALARTSDASAASVLEQIAAQKALIKRGHFSEVQDLARQALASRARGGGQP